jgi:hypothetical protein
MTGKDAIRKLPAIQYTQPAACWACAVTKLQISRVACVCRSVDARSSTTTRPEPALNIRPASLSNNAASALPAPKRRLFAPLTQLTVTSAVRLPRAPAPLPSSTTSTVPNTHATSSQHGRLRRRWHAPQARLGIAVPMPTASADRPSQTAPAPPPPSPCRLRSWCRPSCPSSSSQRYGSPSSSSCARATRGTTARAPPPRRCAPSASSPPPPRGPH